MENKKSKRFSRAQLDINEQNYLFKYHLKIYSTYSKFLNLNERKWLASLI